MHVAHHQLKRDRAERAGTCPVGDGVRIVHRLQRAGFEAARGIVTGGRLYADDLAIGRQGRGGDGAAGQQPATATADEQVVERARVFDEFLGRRTLPGNDVRVIEWRDERQATFAGDGTGKHLTIGDQTVVQHDLGAIAARRGNLHRRRILRHNDGGGDAEQSAGQRHRLRVIARRKRHDALGSPIFRHQRERIESAAELERTRALKIFRLEKNLCAGAFVDAARGQHGCANGVS